MKSSYPILSSIVVVALAACAPKDSGYDTSNPYGTPDGGHTANAPYQAVPPVNPTYDTPAAYEDSTGAPAPVDPAIAPTANVPAATAPTQAAATHTVVKGDTLGGIAAKYKVPMASIKKANNMTKDTVVLGKKMIIPAN